MPDIGDSRRRQPSGTTEGTPVKIRRPQAMKGLAPDASIRTIPVFLLIAAVCAPCLCAGPSAFQAHASRSPAQFKLVRNRRSFSLAFTSKGVTKQIVIPRQWLVPPKEEADEELNAFVLSFNYDSEVQSFEIGDGRIGLHLSSFESGDEGSSRAAAGRDVFLLFDPKTLELREGGIRRGITKARVMDRRCFAANSEHYLIADIDGDGSTDIGVVQEELQCIENSDGWMSGPFYKKFPVAWYVLRKNLWTPESHYDGQMPTRYRELPLIGMACSTIEAAGCEYGCTPGCDRTKWLREIYTASAHGVTAHFGGLMPPQDRPIESGVSALWFTFEGDPRAYGFASMTKDPGDADLKFADWNLNIFSPDGAYVLLLQDEHGPYHIVAIGKLKAYLTAGAKPDYVVPGNVAQNETAHTYSDGHWISAQEVGYTAGYNGASERSTFKLGRESGHDANP